MIKLDWPAPKNIHAFITTRKNDFNLADHVGDDPKKVAKNRQKLKEMLSLPAEPIWLNQQHQNRVIDAALDQNREADGSYTNQKNVICSVLTADCLPIFLCSKLGDEVAILHAGWRSLAVGIIENGIKKFKAAPDQILAFLGPAIGPKVFEVDETVRKAFASNEMSAFTPSRTNHWLADLYLLAKQRLNALKITKIYGGNFCTFTDKKRFYSYRRNNQTGRMASLIWIS